MDGWKDKGWMDGWMDRWMYKGWIRKWISTCLSIYLYVSSIL